MSASDALDDVVVDTNAFVSGVIVRRSIPAQIIDALCRERFRLLTSHEQRDELGDVFTRPRFLRSYAVAVQDSRYLLRYIDLNARFVSIADAPTFDVRDPDDEAILATAVLGNAEFLVIGDSDLLTMANGPLVGRLRIVTPQRVPRRP